MDIQLNTLFVVTRSACVRRESETLQVSIDRKVRLSTPISQLDSVAVFGGVHVTPSAMQLCADRGVAVSFFTESGRLMCRVDAPFSSNVLLRREQYRKADSPEFRAAIARNLVAGKIQNARNLLLRSAREGAADDDQSALQAAATRLGDALPPLADELEVDSIRGREGDAARVYFDVLARMVKVNRSYFTPRGRSRRPPLDAMNALLSFCYALLAHDCSAACQGAGLDPAVGYLHVDRPGRPGLALDLMEEFRPLIADRLVLALINRQQVKESGFEKRDGGAIYMDEATRRTVVGAYQQRKREPVTHPLLNQKTPLGRLPFLQARILARCLRGDLPAYVPCVLKN
jgi:CRISPR-associated protein Cas1